MRKAATATATSCCAFAVPFNYNSNNSLHPQAFNVVDFNIWLTPFDLIVVVRYLEILARLGFRGAFPHVGKVNFNRADFDKGRKFPVSSSSIWHCSNSFIRIEDLQYLLVATLLTQNFSDKEFNRFGLLAPHIA